jgi:hypothetical protein
LFLLAEAEEEPMVMEALMELEAQAEAEEQFKWVGFQPPHLLLLAQAADLIVEAEVAE